VKVATQHDRRNWRAATSLLNDTIESAYGPFRNRENLKCLHMKALGMCNQGRTLGQIKHWAKHSETSGVRPGELSVNQGQALEVKGTAKVM
jgi:hypothetical protein